MNNYEITIGLEVHCELKTASKLFCSCPVSFGKEPNTQCCPVCAGFPGAMPTLNAKAVELAVKAGLALNCSINTLSSWDRKNYYYPDLPKAYQITQYGLPLCENGRLEFEYLGEKKSVKISKIQLEEDAGKLIHLGEKTRIDYNRCGVPLIEIITEPDLHSPEEAVAFLEELRAVLKYAGVSETKMQEGNLRFDVNLSVAKVGEPLGVRTETKNLNSFRAVLNMCKSEANRQIALLNEGKKVIRETRRWDDNLGKGYAMRSKEEISDYRFFPEPDLRPLRLTKSDIERWEREIPTLRAERRERYIKEYSLLRDEAIRLTEDKAISDLFDSAVSLGAPIKKTANLILGDIMRLSKQEGSDTLKVAISPKQLVEALNLVSSGEISLTSLQQKLLPQIWNDEKVEPLTLAKEMGIVQSFSEKDIEKAVKSVVENNETAVSEYKNGNGKVFSYLVGQTMKETKGKANPTLINEILRKMLG